MTIPSIPRPIQAFIDTTNAGDTKAFLATFTQDTYLEDWGRSFNGTKGAASWNHTDNIGVNAHFEVQSLSPGADPNSYILTVRVTGDGFNGIGTINFTLRDELIARMVIS